MEDNKLLENSMKLVESSCAEDIVLGIELLYKHNKQVLLSICPIYISNSEYSSIQTKSSKQGWVVFEDFSIWLWKYNNGHDRSDGRMVRILEEDMSLYKRANNFENLRLN